MNTPKTLTTTESNQLIYFLHKSNGSAQEIKKAARNTCIALLMLDAGLRVGEVARLRRSSLVTLTEAVLQIWIPAKITKTKTERIVPTTERLRISIDELRGYCWTEDLYAGDRYAFVGEDPLKHISVRQIERIIAFGGMCAFGRSVHPHILRHTFASRLMRITNSRIVQQLLGHKSLNSTQIYTHPNGDDLINAIKKI